VAVQAASAIEDVHQQERRRVGEPVGDRDGAVQVDVEVRPLARGEIPEPGALVATPFFVAAIASIAIWQLLCLVCPAPAAALFVFGLYAGYNHFALIHHWVHHRHSEIGGGSYWRRLDRLHRAHHHRQGSNFGVSMMMWDGVFGTLRPVSEKTKSSCSNLS